MTVKEFGELAFCTEVIEVESAYNGKVLCKRFVAAKHPAIAEREVVGFRSAIRVSRDGQYASAVTIVSVNGKIEYEKERGEAK